MENIAIIDLKFLDTNEAIASFLVETSHGPVLVETGPESTFEQLKEGVERNGYQLEEIKHILLTHIHFDHAGAAWKLAETGAKIYVHPVGAPHLASPEKLWNSAKQIYGNEMERLWGEMKPIPADQIIEVQHEEELEFGNIKFKALHTPGHATHHIAWKMGNVIFTGDVAGVKINGGPAVPPCPPPDINIGDWEVSLAILKAEKPECLFLTHFGIINNVNEHLDNLCYMLHDWSKWIKPHFDANREQKEVIPLFMEYTKVHLTREGCDDALIKVYEYANPSWMSVAGLYRYWKLKSQGRI
ncbi:MBL fold metallo-hydrolase [Aquiflexum lacus]|uniref:MBL fold metallo-hydrolase n=1 Tax=Aquiflexum lacus TaxID=2483805 RepID=UPI001893DE10|nr:MBL fold metallo-hydrolase [Aquiflexum lacus]